MYLLNQIVRLFHTTRHLKLKQVYYRFYYLLRAYLRPYALLQVRNKTRLAPILRFWERDWCEPAIFDLGMMDITHVEFLGVKGRIAQPTDWSNPQYTHLWLYHLHYFNGLNARDAQCHMALLNGWIQRWIEENPSQQGVGWEPYPLSLRIVNWIKWFLKTHDVQTDIPGICLNSLYLQAHILSKNLEYHILANHLFANAKALIFAGVYFQGKKAAFWLARGLRILDQELKEQFLADGGHFELSPMYHAIMLWDLCDLIQLAQRTKFASLTRRQIEWQTQLVKGLRWLDAMTHPDGQISFFNDATLGAAPTLADVKRYAAQLGIEYESAFFVQSALNVHWLKESGYVVVRSKNQHQLICDVAHVGPAYQPGHAHADTLSFELSLYGQRVMVNSGVSEYGTGSLRQAQRATKAHNTVCLEGANSSEVWSGFRVARRANPQDITVLSQPNDSMMIRGSHDGYWRLTGRNRHARAWQFSDRQLFIQDEIQGSFKEAEARFYFHPDVRQIQLDYAIMTAILADGQCVKIVVHDAQALSLESTTWYPGFGQAVNNQCLVVRFANNLLTTQITW